MKAHPSEHHVTLSRVETAVSLIQALVNCAIGFCKYPQPHHRHSQGYWDAIAAWTHGEAMGRVLHLLFNSPQAPVGLQSTGDEYECVCRILSWNLVGCVSVRWRALMCFRYNRC